VAFVTVGGWAGMAATSFAAALLLATNGFGFAVLAVPFFLVLAPPGEGIPVIIIMSLGISLLVLPGLARSIDPQLLLRLTAGSLVGLGFGLVARAYTDLLVVRAVAGATIALFAAVLAWNRNRGLVRLIVRRPRYDLAAGAVAGVATAMVGMPGPPVMVYLMLAGATARLVRATLIAFFALVYAVTVAADTLWFGLAGREWAIAASLMPFAWVGGVVGLRLGDRIGERTATVLAIAVLAVAGLYTLAAAVGPALW
jgi:uncharacterized membrane protein YfcA